MATTKQTAFSMTGGLITDYSKAYMPPGSLLGCTNFEPTVSGYERSQGFERYDGQTLASSIALNETADPIDDTAREAQRALIGEVPGSGPVRGVAVYKGEVYAFRDNAVGDACLLYKESGAGWKEVVITPTLSPGGDYSFVVNNFLASAGSEKLYGCDGINPPFEFDGTTFTQITHGASVEPTAITAHAMHLFLGFKEGSIMHSVVGEPTNFDAASGAGEVGVGSPVTNMMSLVNDSLLITCENKISLLYGTSQIDWQSNEVRTFQAGVGAKKKTLQDFYGSAVYMDGNAITSLSAANDYSNFRSQQLSSLAHQAVKSLKSDPTGSCAVFGKDQYRVYAPDTNGKTEAYIITKVEKGTSIGRMLLPIDIRCVATGYQGDVQSIFYGAADGFVYKADSGSSFDGESITATITTAFDSIKSPMLRKRFKHATLIGYTDKDATIRIRPQFSYSSNDVSSHRNIDADILGGGGIWGTDNWGEFLWSREALSLNRIDVAGVGTSISLTVYFEGKFSEVFTIDSGIIDYIPRRLER